jgi:alkylation response protein AidB-like acyl-CoA dehydrogenase
MRLPGVEIRPILALDGRYHNCEVFYDNVRIPLSNVVGEIDGGWSVAMTTFGFERGPAAFGGFCELEVALEELIAYARSQVDPRSGAPMIEDSAIAERLGMLRAQLQSIRALVYTMVAASEQGMDLGAEGSILHLPYGEMEQAVSRCALDLIGVQSLSRAASESAIHRYFSSFAATIAGGTSEIHRNIIGERLLGLPR